MFVAYWVPITVVGAQHRAADGTRTLLSKNFLLPFAYRAPSACRRHHLFFREPRVLVSSQWVGLGWGSVVEHLLGVQEATVSCILKKKIPSLACGGVFVGLPQLSICSTDLCVCPSVCATVSWFDISIVSLKSGWYDLSLQVSLFVFISANVHHHWVLIGIAFLCIHVGRMDVCAGSCPRPHEHGMPLHFLKRSLSPLTLLSS